MFRETFHLARLLPLIGVLLFTSISLEAQNEIVQNPEAVLLRKVWMVRGGVVGGDRVGDGAGGVGFINSDSIADFAVRIGVTSQWQIFYGGNPDTLSTQPAWTFENSIAQPDYPVSGQFWGSEKTDGGLGFMRREQVLIEGRTRYYHRLYVFRKTVKGLPAEATIVLDPERTIAERLEYAPRAVYGTDLDQDGDDELIVVSSSRLIDQTVDRRAEVWIYEGGPNFQLDTPTVVLKDTEENYTDLYAAVGDLDGDSLPDIMIGANYVGSGPGNRPIQYKFWWGKENLSSLSVNPDRSVTLDKASVNIDAKFMLLDCDGDGVQDILRTLWANPLGAYLYRSRVGKNIRDRAITTEEADGYFPGYSIFGNGGYLGDSLRRFESTIMLGSRMMFFQGGKNGPNYSYDAYYSAQDDGMTAGNVFGVGGPVGDVLGNGYCAYLTANPAWFGGDQGIAILLEGGPYIPTDDPTSGIEAVATDEHHAALHIWPNPVVDQLHVAWRGDLKAPPSRLRIFDMTGRLVVEQDVDGWRGEALWRCSSVPSGSYLLAVYDREGASLAQTIIIKQ